MSAVSKTETWIFFDMDGTLCDVKSAVEAGLRAVIATIAQGVDVDSVVLSPKVFQDCWLRLAQKRLGSGDSHESIRRDSIRKVLLDSGLIVSDSHLELAFKQYFCTRFRCTSTYDDVVPTLDVLRARFNLGLISNGNSYAARIGLSNVFDAEFYGQELGVRKPDRRVYLRVMRELDLIPEHCVMVGDTFEDDVEAPRSVGWHAIAIDRSFSHAKGGMVIHSLFELNSRLKALALG